MSTTFMKTPIKTPARNRALKTLHQKAEMVSMSFDEMFDRDVWKESPKKCTFKIHKDEPATKKTTSWKPSFSIFTATSN